MYFFSEEQTSQNKISLNLQQNRTIINCFNTFFKKCRSRISHMTKNQVVHIVRDHRLIMYTVCTILHIQRLKVVCTSPLVQFSSKIMNEYPYFLHACRLFSIVLWYVY